MAMIDIDWLAEHVDIPQDLSCEQLAQDLVSVGFEEEAIHERQVIGPVVVGFVLDAVREPQKNGKTISWCHIDCGEKFNGKDSEGKVVPRQIVCGAPNMAAGEKVVVALPGAVLPGNFAIEPRKTYGHLSEGMCASERELGLSDEHNGIILLRELGLSEHELEQCQPGDDALALFGLDTPLLEINITPDRGYALSYRGIAREYHHATGASFTDPIQALDARAKLVANVKDSAEPQVNTILPEVIIDDSAPIHGVAGCDRLHLRAVENVDATAKVPQWMRRRLQRSGMRSLSAVVDITNYVMLDLGQPMHAYDLDCIEGPIVVRRAVDGETLVTLDGKTRNLHHEDLLITDSPEGKQGSRILGIAGVMGGQYGQVTGETKRVLLEAAHFDAVSIARSSRRHKIPSEAARRFERGVDPTIQAAAAQMACDMLKRLCNGHPSDQAFDLGEVERQPVILFKANEVERVTGMSVDLLRINAILEDIGCKVAGGGNGEFSVSTPSWRPDLRQACDLVEEVARIIGYDKIPVTIPSSKINSLGGLTANQRRERAVAHALAQGGLIEVLTYPFVGDADWKQLHADTQVLTNCSVKIENPLAADRPYLRTTMLITLMNAVRRNIRRGIEHVKVFEIGHVYLADPQAPAIPALPGGVKPTTEQLAALDAGLPDQPLHVAGVMSGLSDATGWLKQDRYADYTDAIEMVTRLADRFGITFTIENGSLPEYQGCMHPGRSARISYEGKSIGVLGELHPRVIEELGLCEHTAIFELNLTALFDRLDETPVKAKPISTYPPVRQDMAFSVGEGCTAASLEQVIRQETGELLEDLQLFDVFNGDQMEQGQRSLAFALTLRAKDRTLEGSQVETIRQAIVDAAKQLGATLRA